MRRMERRLTGSIATLLILLVLYQNAWGNDSITVHNIRAGFHPHFTRLAFDSEGARPFRVGSASPSQIIRKSEVKKVAPHSEITETSTVADLTKSSKARAPEKGLVLAGKKSPPVHVTTDESSRVQPDANEILRRADEARGNLKGVKWTVHIVSTERERKQERKLEVKSKAYDFLAIFIDPPRVKGQKVLMVDHNMWFMKPGLRKPVPISPRQRLVGGAAYGDIAATNYASDYEITSLGEDLFSNEPCYLFDLKAVAKNATYDRIKYWVSKERIVGLKAEFYTVSGKLFKSATFEYKNQIKLENNSNPFISRMNITDALLEDNLTTMTFSAHQIVDIPHATFDLNFLMMR